MVWRWDQILQTAPVWPLAGLRLVVTARDGMKSAEISCLREDPGTAHRETRLTLLPCSLKAFVSFLMTSKAFVQDNMTCFIK